MARCWRRYAVRGQGRCGDCPSAHWQRAPAGVQPPARRLDRFFGSSSLTPRPTQEACAHDRSFTPFIIPQTMNPPCSGRRRRQLLALKQAGQREFGTESRCLFLALRLVRSFSRRSTTDYRTHFFLPPLALAPQHSLPVSKFCFLSVNTASYQRIQQMIIKTSVERACRVRLGWLQAP